MLLGSMMETAASAGGLDGSSAGTPLLAMPGVAASNAGASKAPRATDFSIAAIMGRNRNGAVRIAGQIPRTTRPAGKICMARSMDYHVCLFGGGGTSYVGLSL